MILKKVDPHVASEAEIWDAVVCANRPDLRMNAIHAASRSGMLKDPRLAVLCRTSSLQPIAAALDQQVLVQGPAVEDPNHRHPLHDEIVRMRVIAPAIPSGLCGVAFHQGLTPNERHAAFRILLDHFFESADPHHLQMAWDFKLSECEGWADCALKPDLDFFRVQQGYGFAFLIDPLWRSFDDCLGAMRRRYRSHHLRWIRRADSAGLSVSTSDCLDDWLSPAVLLLQDVTTRQGIYYDIPGIEFLREFSRLPGARLTICLHQATQSLRGVNLLLHGGDTLFNLYAGFRADDHAVYQVLLRHSVECAIELGCRYLQLGQRADLSKRRLGAIPSQMFLYARHPNGQIHSQLRELGTPAGLPHEDIQPLAGYRRIFRREQRIRLFSDQPRAGSKK